MGKNLEGRNKDTLLQVVVVVVAAAVVVVVVPICESLNGFQSLSSTAQQRHASLVAVVALVEKSSRRKTRWLVRDRHSKEAVFEGNHC